MLTLLVVRCSWLCTFAIVKSHGVVDVLEVVLILSVVAAVTQMLFNLSTYDGKDPDMNTIDFGSKK